MFFINRAHAAQGVRKYGSAIIPHITYDKDINYVIKRSTRLKGTKFFVRRDFSRETKPDRQVQIRQVLLALSRKIKEDFTKCKNFLTVDKLSVN